MRTIRINLNKSGSIDAAIKALQDYRTGLKDKVKALVEALAKDGVDVANAWVMASQGDSQKPNVIYQVNESGDIIKAEVSMTGKDVLFIEFGAGYYYNETDPPHAAEFNYGVGTYPGQKHAFQRGWYYYDESGEKAYSHGTEGTYPMYHAAETMRNNAIKRALETFSSR